MRKTWAVTAAATRVPRRLAVLVLAGALLPSCSGADAGGPVTAQPSAAPVAAAAAAGGACQLLDYARIEQRLGLAFTVAGAAGRDRTSTCVLRPGEAALPELTLSVTPTAADVSVFKDTMRPAGAKAVAGLGRIAYCATKPATSGRGPSIEVGWLTGNARMLLLKVTLDSAGDAEELAPKLVVLAKELDRSSL